MFSDCLRRFLSRRLYAIDCPTIYGLSTLLKKRVSPFRETLQLARYVRRRYMQAAPTRLTEFLIVISKKRHVRIFHPRRVLDHLTRTQEDNHPQDTLSQRGYTLTIL